MNLPTEAFSEEKLLALFQAHKIESMKRYVSKYFIKLNNTTSVLKWDPDTKSFLQFEDKVIDSRYITKDLVYYNGKYLEFSLNNWFRSIANPSYTPCMKMNKPFFYVSESGTKYVNLMKQPKFAFNKRKHLKDYDNKIQKGVKKLWDHVKVVLCANREDQFNYNKKWISNVIAGRKMITAMYIRSAQGIGKSILIEIFKAVLGEELVTSASNADVIVGQFNGALMNIRVYCLEEASCESLQQFKQMDGKLKDYITNAIMLIRLMHKDHFKVENTCNFIVITNENNAIQIQPKTRRWFQNDVSTIFQNNKKYFDVIRALLKDPEVQEAFYWDCLDISEEFPKFDEINERVISDAVKTNIATTAPVIIIFLKEKYVLKNLGIDMKSGSLYNHYVEYCKNNKINYILKKAQAIEAWVELGLEYISADTKHHNQNWITCSKEDLYNIFKKNHYLHETDDFTNKGDDGDDEEDMKILDNEITPNNNKEEVKVEVKENPKEVKEEVKEEVKVEVKENPKEVKEEVKVEVKENPKEEKDNWKDIQEINKERRRKYPKSKSVIWEGMSRLEHLEMQDKETNFSNVTKEELFNMFN